MTDTKPVRTARRMVAIFWAFTVLYIALGIALIATRGATGLIFVAILVFAWLFRGLPDTRPHFKVLREARLGTGPSGSKQVRPVR